MIYIGAEEVISPLGASIEDNFLAVTANRTGISLVHDAGFNQGSVYLGKIVDLPDGNKFESLVTSMIYQLSHKIDSQILLSKKTIVLISSTKGELERKIEDPFGQTVSSVMGRFRFANQPIVISNACISGVLAINAAHNFISAKLYDHAIVIGCDLISDFVLFGFQSLFAISDKPCKPFDATRNGITMGEGCGAVVVSNSKTIFKDEPLTLLPGTSANDANHISGPSRTGEGLYRTVSKTLKINSLTSKNIDFVSAHGTGTIYNDDMESYAFDRCGLTHIPVNSFKGYFGHTLGAAGTIEIAMSMQSLRNNILIKSLGFQTSGTAKELNVIRENRKVEMNTILKTASGFGGGNASLIIQKL